jgi:hypothetical protein
MTNIADLHKSKPSVNRGGVQSTGRPSDRRAIPAADRRGRAAPQEAEPSPGIHPLAFRLPLVAAAWFVISMAISFADTLETGYLMAIVAGFAVVFFGLVTVLGMRASDSRRWLGSATSFRRFVRGKVAVHTGRISGREALVQLTVLPVTLALGGMAIGLVYVLVR